MQRQARFNVALMQDDMTSAGMEAADLARACRPVAARSTVTRFFSGAHQTAGMAKRIARALKHPLERYVIRSAEAPAA